MANVKDGVESDLIRGRGFSRASKFSEVQISSTDLPPNKLFAAHYQHGRPPLRTPNSLLRYSLPTDPTILDGQHYLHLPKPTDNPPPLLPHDNRTPIPVPNLPFPPPLPPSSLETFSQIHNRLLHTPLNLLHDPPSPRVLHRRSARWAPKARRCCYTFQ